MFLSGGSGGGLVQSGAFYSAATSAPVASMEAGSAASQPTTDPTQAAAPQPALTQGILDLKFLFVTSKAHLICFVVRHKFQVFITENTCFYLVDGHCS